MTELQSDSITKLMPALIAAAQEFAPAVKRSTNPAFRSKYADLDSVLDAVNPALLSHGIYLSQQPHMADGRMLLFTKLIHESGEWIGCTYAINPVKQDPQGEGSALTYSRRYSALAICGIAPEGDDGNAASQRPAPPRPTETSRPAAPVDTYDDPKPLAELIDTAVSPGGLAEVAKAIAEAALTGTDRETLKAAYTAKMRALKAAA